MRTDVAIIGGGPSGLLLGELLHKAGIATVVLERRTRAWVLARIRAGVLEWGAVELLRRAGVGARMDRDGLIHGGTFIAARNRQFRLDFVKSAGRKVMVWGQTEITHDLYAARDAWGGPVIEEAEGVTLHGPDGETPRVTWVKDGAEHGLDCRFVAGCDGFHGVSRRTIPAGVLREYERVYPFAWLGVLSETPPVSHEIIYANHERGFALCSMRRRDLSRSYIQVGADEPAEAWTDAAFWDELRRRIPPEAAERMVTGPAIERSVAPLRSFVAEPMRWGSLFLAGDAAHIVPPTGAKGLNLAASDIHYLSEALIAKFRDGENGGIDTYSGRALARVWKAERFSWWMTNTLHRFPDQGDFGQRMQEAEIDYLSQSQAAQASFAENYTGLPY